jgi:hypothetical protein
MCNPLEKVKTMSESKCKVRVDKEMRKRIHDLHQLWKAYKQGYERDGDTDTLANYGLSFDYVAPGTFDDQLEGYFRYQLSWGGPSDEFRFFVNLDHSCHRVEYWYLDWFDGASVTPSDGEQSFLFEIWEWFRETGSVEAALKERVQ